MQTRQHLQQLTVQQHMLDPERWAVFHSWFLVSGDTKVTFFFLFYEQKTSKKIEQIEFDSPQKKCWTFFLGDALKNEGCRPLLMTCWMKSVATWLPENLPLVGPLKCLFINPKYSQDHLYIYSSFCFCSLRVCI